MKQEGWPGSSLGPSRADTQVRTLAHCFRPLRAGAYAGLDLLEAYVPSLRVDGASFTLRENVQSSGKDSDIQANESSLCDKTNVFRLVDKLRPESCHHT